MRELGHVRDFEKSVSAEDLSSLFKRSSKRAVLTFVGLGDALRILKQTLEEAEGILHAVGGHWKTDIARQTKCLEEWCPNWQAARGQLMSKAHTGTVLSLVKNPHYAELGTAAGELSATVALVKGVHKDSGCPLVDASALREASIACTLAVDTVVVTNALFRLRVEVPRLESPQARKKAAVELQKLLAERGTDVGDDVRSALDEMLQ